MLAKLWVTWSSMRRTYVGRHRIGSSRNDASFDNDETVEVQPELVE